MADQPTAASLLTAGQLTFVQTLAQLSGLDVNVIAAWALSEESSSAATARQAAGNHNWLNIAYFDSGPGSITREGVWRDPQSAARATWEFLQGKRWGASPGIQRIAGTAGQPAAVQINTIAGSGWASSGYNGGATLRSLYQRLTGSGGIAGARLTGSVPIHDAAGGGGDTSDGGLFKPLFDGIVKALVWIALVLGGATLIGVGVARATGAGKAAPA